MTKTSTTTSSTTVTEYKEVTKPYNKWLIATIIIIIVVAVLGLIAKRR